MQWRRFASIVRAHGIGAALRRALAKGRREMAILARERERRRSWRRALVLSSRAAAVHVAPCERPGLSVIVLAFDTTAPKLAACLHALADGRDGIAMEAIVALGDDTASAIDEFLASCSGVHFVRVPARSAFGAVVNACAQAAHGTYLQVLDAQTVVTAGWARAAIGCFERDERVGAVTPQVRRRDGGVVHAGGVVWSDGCIGAVGDGCEPGSAGVGFLRRVDAAFARGFMVRADRFAQVGGVDEALRDPAYAVADLSFRLAACGHDVIYQPEVILLDRDGVHGEASPPAQFVQRWSDRLARQCVASVRSCAAAAQYGDGARTVLVMDEIVPRDDRDAGSRRLVAIVELLRSLRWHVVFVPLRGGAFEEDARLLRARGCEVRTHRGDANQALERLAIAPDLAWLARPAACDWYLARASQRAPAIYDTVDLHHVRLEREEALLGIATAWQEMRDLEMRLMHASRCTVVTSTAEQQILAQRGVRAEVVPIVETPIRDVCACTHRSGVLFVGNLTHAPNRDALRWLVRDVLPHVRERLPSVHVTVAGYDPNGVARVYRSRSVRVVGHVADLAPYFAATRVFVAPLRYGAGAKGKIVQSLAHGVPVVTTPAGAEGLGLCDGAECLIRTGPDDFAHAIANVATDDVLWQRMSRAAQSSASRFSPDAVRGVLAALLEAATSDVTTA